MKKILSIDGGGIRGIIPALVLAEIEKRTGKPMSEAFDLIAGTSTGGILALGLSKKDVGGPKYSAEDLVEIYRNRGKDIFPSSLWRSVGSLGNEEYSSTGIEKVLKEYFGNDILGNTLTKTLITSYDIQGRAPFFFKSWKKVHSMTEIRKVARATSAAPTYFEPALLDIGGIKRSLVDGGIFINNPTMSAYVEAKKLYPNEKDFYVLSLGTGELNRPISHSDAKDFGKIGWIKPLLSCVFDGVTDAVDYQMEQLLDENYIRLQTTLESADDDLDNVKNSNIIALEKEAKRLLVIYESKIQEVCKVLNN